MRLSSTFILLCAVCTVLMGCTRSLPLISHAHIGHSLTAWRDTPDQEGLFVVAEKETKVAFEHAQQAVNNAQTPAIARQHLSNVVHALNPDIQSEGSGLGYGAIRALEGAVDHIKFAAESKDASNNLIASTKQFSYGARPLLDRLRLAVEVAQLARRSSAAELPGLADELRQLMYQNLNGKDTDGNGIVDPASDEHGLAQLRQGLVSMLSNEKPPYNPLGRKYLLGLIRLPNGQWVYNFDNSNESSTSSSGYEDY